MGSFVVEEEFYLNGEPFKIISGAFHYFRTVPQYWQDRLEKAKAMGLNTIETYIPWNLHEPKPGEYCFSGILDIEQFIMMAKNLGLYVIIRPSPYICAEWEFGGLPAWLLKEDGMKLRVNYKPFLDAVNRYYDALFPHLTKYQITEGGPIILMQIENEYGYFANDKTYMLAMKDMMIKHGVTVPLITSDGPFEESMNGGAIPGVLETGNFGSRTVERFEVLKKYVDGKPLMCAEFWVGWFDHWGNGGHMTGNLEESVKDLDDMLRLGNVNIYMFQGGTNFGFMNGSNYYDEITPDVTSYDYDAMLTEDGQITEKYRRYKEVIAKYAQIPEVEFTTKIERKAYGKMYITDKVSLFDTLDKISEPVDSVYPQSMERLDQSYGYILYHSTLNTETGIEKIRLWDANDRANIFVDQKHLLTLYDRELLVEHEAKRDLKGGEPIDILMENMGRVNFGPMMQVQRKGIDRCVQINGHMHNHWRQYCLPLTNIDKVDFTGEYKTGVPAFYKGNLVVNDSADTFLELEGWGKGCVFVNGFNIGRFWEIGPQKRLYIPGPLLREGDNEIIIFETEGKATEFVEFKDVPDLG